MAKKQMDWDFADVQLDKSQKGDVESFAESMEDDLQALFDILSDDGVKISMSYVESKTSWCISFTPQKGGKLATGVTMTTWSLNPIEALWMGGYKHVVICKRKDYPVRSDESAWG